MFFNGNGFYHQTTAAIGAWFVDRYLDQNESFLKEPSPLASDFIQTFWDFGYQKKNFIFLITPVEFYGWKMYPLEDIHENVTSYGNHN